MFIQSKIMYQATFLSNTWLVCQKNLKEGCLLQAVSAKVALRLKGGELTEAGQRVEDANKAVEEARDEADRKVKEMREEVDSLTQYYNQKVTTGDG